MFEVDRPHKDFLGLMPEIELLRSTIAHNHQHNQPQTEEIVIDGGIDRFDHFATKAVEEFFAEELVA